MVEDMVGTEVVVEKAPELPALSKVPTATAITARCSHQHSWSTSQHKLPKSKHLAPSFIIITIITIVLALVIATSAISINIVGLSIKLTKTTIVTIFKLEVWEREHPLRRPRPRRRLWEEILLWEHGGRILPLRLLQVQERLRSSKQRLRWRLRWRRTPLNPVLNQRLRKAALNYIQIFTVADLKHIIVRLFGFLIVIQFS